jgi:hypothetical protein
MLLGNPGSLARLKDMGFKTFDQWWDESYDSEQNLHNRVRKIIRELKKLNQLTVAELQHLRTGMRSTIEHNQQLINEMGSKLPDPHILNDSFFSRSKTAVRSSQPKFLFGQMENFDSASGHR